MPAIPAINAITLGTIAHDYAGRSLHTAGNILMRRDSNNHVGEVIGVGKPLLSLSVLVFLLYQY